MTPNINTQWPSQRLDHDQIMGPVIDACISVCNNKEIPRQANFTNKTGFFGLRVLNVKGIGVASVDGAPAGTVLRQHKASHGDRWGACVFCVSVQPVPLS